MYNKNMNLDGLLSIDQALHVLSQGQLIRKSDEMVLFEMDDRKRVKVSGVNMSFRISRADFYLLYGHCSFILYQREEGIDDHKDEAYYAWRYKSQ